MHARRRMDQRSPFSLALAARVVSRGGIVLSEHSYARDEAEYEGLVTFGKVAELPRLLDQQLYPVDPPRRSSARRVLQTRMEIVQLYSERAHGFLLLALVIGERVVQVVEQLPKLDRPVAIGVHGGKELINLGLGLPLAH